MLVEELLDLCREGLLLGRELEIHARAPLAPAAPAARPDGRIRRPHLTGRQIAQIIFIGPGRAPGRSAPRRTMKSDVGISIQ